MAPSRISPEVSNDTVVQGLSSEQLDSWNKNGYLLIPDELNLDTVSTLLQETRQLLNDFPIDEHPMTKFSTGTGEDKHIGDDYFLTSGDKVRFFFEEDAFASDGSLTKPKHLAINKIGHSLHTLLPSFRKISLSSRNAAIARSLRYQDPRVLQSMVICKQPEIGGAVPPHQDSTFLYTDPPSAVGFWYALEDATIKNGCLSFADGSHKSSEVENRFVTLEKGGTGFQEVRGARYPHGEGQDVGAPAEETQDDYTNGEVKAGTLVLIHGNLMHKSEKNLSGKSRFIYTFHMIEGRNDYDERNWLQPTRDGFSRLYV
ncbi:MAG: hypothetical protein M1828_007469 [Chrysothrix sp. TS-e1954]|nr:MAG: hypothetical protein M1828_007469 [Chrysothrix sp. TS-e1954]